MKYATHRPYSVPEKAARRLMEHAQAFEPIQDGRIYIEKINGPFLFCEGNARRVQRRPGACDIARLARDARERHVREAHAERRRLVRLTMPWSTPFEDPIPLPGGRKLVTLKDAADYITKLPKAEQNKPEWQTAIHCLIGAAEGRNFLMHARIGVLKALNAGKPNPDVTPRVKKAKAYRIQR
jgi:hypothetical protein